MNNKYAENTVYSNTVMAVKPALTQKRQEMLNVHHHKALRGSAVGLQSNTFIP